MRLYVDSADLNDIADWDRHPWVSGFTTNPTLMGAVGIDDPWLWAKRVVDLTDKPVSIDGPPQVSELGPNVWRKVTNCQERRGRLVDESVPLNVTAICTAAQVPHASILTSSDIISVFAGRIMDTGRDPQPVIDAAKQTGAQVLWASVREPYNILQAERAGCDIITVPPAILRKWLDWQGKPLELVAAETIAQFKRDAEGLW